MEKIGQLNAYGCVYASEEWHCNHLRGIHRLYYVHRGCGGCRHNGKEYVFQAGMLYFIPFSEDFKPYSDPNNPILHSYADFERIPPILTDRILSALPEPGNERLSAALQVFFAGAKDAPKSENPDCQPEWDEAFGRLCKESILYVTDFIAKENGIPVIEDEMVLEVIEEYHENLQAPFPVEILAEKYDMSKDGFIRYFKKETGMTPHAYLKALRLTTARYLRKNGWTYEEIAEHVGYSDASALLHAMQK